MQHWHRTLTIMVVVEFVAAAGFSSTFPFQALYIEQLGSRWHLNIEFLTGLSFSAQSFTQMIVAPIWGSLADRQGRKLMVERATFGAAITVFLMAFARSAEDLIALRALQGVVSGVLAAVTALVAANVPRERVGYALGLIQVGLWAGIAAGPLIGGVVADLFSYRVAFGVTAALLALSGLLVLFGAQETFKPVKKNKSDRISLWASWRLVMARPGVPATFTTDFLQQFARNMMTPFIPLYIAALLPQSDRVATITGIVSGLSAFTGTLGAIYLGRLGDRRGHRPILIGVGIAGMVLFLPQAVVGNVWAFVGLQTAAGVTAGGCMPAISALLAHYSLPGEEGAVFGLENSIVALARTLAPMIGSVLIVWVSLRGIFAATALMYGIMVLLVFAWLPRLHLEQASVEVQADVEIKEKAL